MGVLATVGSGARDIERAVYQRELLRAQLVPVSVRFMGGEPDLGLGNHHPDPISGKRETTSCEVD